MDTATTTLPDLNTVTNTTTDHDTPMLQQHTLD